MRELLHDLMVIALGGGGGDWVERLAQIGGRSTRKVDLLMFGDFGKDQDDEKALAMAVTCSTPNPNPNPHPRTPTLALIATPTPTLPLPLPLPQVTLQHAGCLQRISVISNLGDSKMRARLAKGTLNVLEARDTEVAVGSDGGRAGDTIHEYEFAGCTYLPLTLP